MMTDRLDLQLQHNLHLKHVEPLAWHQSQISSSLRPTGEEGRNGSLDLVPLGKGLNEHVCLCVLDSPAHNLMCEQNSTHFWILILSLIRYGLRGGKEEQ